MQRFETGDGGFQNILSSGQGRGLGIQRGGRSFTGRQRRALENKGCPVLQISYLGTKVCMVRALFLVQALLPV